MSTFQIETSFYKAVLYISRNNGIMHVSPFMKHSKNWQKIKKYNFLLFPSVLPDELHSWFTGAITTLLMLSNL